MKDFDRTVRTALSLLMVYGAMTGFAEAQVIAPIGTELQSWTTVFDANLIPFVITAALLFVVVMWAISAKLGIFTFICVVVGALIYGFRAAVIGLAGGA